MKQYLSIENVFAREIIDSRGNPTVEAEVIAGGDICQCTADLIFLVERSMVFV